MWFSWTHNKTRKPANERPVFWWRQLEAEPRSGLPFGHLFPRPPASRRPAPSEAQRLIGELIAADPPERMEEIVQTYQYKPPQRHWEPVEQWQILAIARVDEAESAVWGEDGGQVVEWFDQGELMHAWPTAPIPQMELSPLPRGLARVVTWFKGLMERPDSLELASAEY